MNALNLLDPLRAAALRGDVIAVHDVLGAIHAADPTESVRAILDPSIAQSLEILDGLEQPSTLRGAALAVRNIAAFVLFGLACRQFLAMPW